MSSPTFLPLDDVVYGEAVQVAPDVRRVIAENPSKFTYRGTGTYIIGNGDVVVIDPGPRLDSHRDALAAALATGQVGKYVADFPVPGLIDHENVMLTPHLGASTAEAEENCAVMAADQLMRFLQTGSIVNSVNFPTVSMERIEGYRLAVTNKNVPGMLGQMTTVLAERNINVIDLINKSRDDLAYNLIDLAEAPDEGLLDAIAAIEGVIGVRVLSAQGGLVELDLVPGWLVAVIIGREAIVKPLPTGNDGQACLVARLKCRVRQL